jgi:hypothetical protein
MATMKRNPYLGWEIFKIESKQMRNICFLSFCRKYFSSCLFNYIRVFQEPNRDANWDSVLQNHFITVLSTLTA